jgi:hypothetical protein
MTFDDFLDTLDRRITSQQHLVNGIKAPMIRRALNRDLRRHLRHPSSDAQVRDGRPWGTPASSTRGV